MAKAAQKDGVKSELQKYFGVIAVYEREFKKWEGRVDKILERYRDEKRKNANSLTRFNILWSNVQTLVPATFSKLPQPDVSRRFRDQDPTGRVASMILERALDFEIQHYSDYRSTMKQAVMDRFLGGRGTAWARYEPHIRAVQLGEPQDGVGATEDIDEPREELDYECAPVDYVHWRDFGHTVARTWEEVGQVWRRVYMLGPAKVERFGEELAAKIPKDSRPKDGRYDPNTGGDTDDGSWIYELWDKNNKRAYWFHKSMQDFLDERDDPLGLEDFFPCPTPLYATITNETLVPVPDFTLYQDQAKELDTLADRIDGLIYMLQVKGVYDGSETVLGRVFTEGDNGKLLPVKNWSAFSEKGGLRGGIEVMDLTPIAAALKEAYMAFAEIKNHIYELTGISDIVRGQSSGPVKSATEKQMQGQYASLRLRSMQEGVAQFATQLLQLKAQIMCAKFSPETLVKISAADQLSEQDQQMLPQALALLVGEQRLMDPEAPQGPNPMRSFRVEVAADTLVQIDEQAEKEGRMEFLKANSDFLVSAGQIMSQAGPAAPALAPAIMEMWKFGVSAFKAGKALEGAIDEAADKLKQILSQPKPAAPPDPKLQAAQVAAQAEMHKTQADMQLVPIKAAAEQAKAQADIVTAQANVQKAQIQAVPRALVVQ